MSVDDALEYVLNMAVTAALKEEDVDTNPELQEEFDEQWDAIMKVTDALPALRGMEHI